MDPQNRCFISWNILWKWMMTRGTTILGNLHVDKVKSYQIMFESKRTIWNVLYKFGGYYFRSVDIDLTTIHGAETRLPKCQKIGSTCNAMVSYGSLALSSHNNIVGTSQHVIPLSSFLDAYLQFFSDTSSLLAVIIPKTT
jgi:hypothetical protein